MSEHDNRVESGGVEIEYDPETATHRTVHERAGETSLSATLLLAIETVADVDSEELPPLFERIDTDALDNLFDPVETATTGGQRLRSRATFSYAGFLVTIYEDGEITFRPLAEGFQTDHE